MDSSALVQRGGVQEIRGQRIDVGTEYTQVKVLGEGNFGLTLLMQHAEGNLVAVKFIKRGPGNVDERTRREVLHHYNLPAHRHLIKFLELFVTTTHLAIVMEYAAGGALREHVVGLGLKRSEATAQYFFRQIVVGVQYLHMHSLCHRDLKLDNILLSHSPRGLPCVKICDFGFAKSEELDSVVKSRIGTLCFAPPEVLERDRNDKHAYSGKQADVWSLGVCLFLMASGTLPFVSSVGSGQKLSDRLIAERIITMDWREASPAAATLSAPLQDLLDGMLRKDPARRLTIDQVGLHAWTQQDMGTGPPECTWVPEPPRQSEEELRRLLQEAQTSRPTEHKFNEEDQVSVGGPGGPPKGEDPALRRFMNY